MDCVPCQPRVLPRAPERTQLTNRAEDLIVQYEGWLRGLTSFDPNPFIDQIFKNGRPYKAFFYLAAFITTIAAVPLFFLTIPLWLILLTVACPLTFISNLKFLPIEIKLLLKNFGFSCDFSYCFLLHVS
ncbi:hypothetical protein DSO57_1033442 [Entomophthora muscae]|uniref:Uncharacterized protein n=1 Tax=Entomophthora muscae TaxID=34485 RepID=A0ACC2RF98_9FUNG|nr:hypothetical protein DSO57_1033442 [Entomophthora muscae]